MKSKAFPPGKPNKTHVSWTLIVSRQAQGVCQSKQVPESKDFRWELSATSPPWPGPVLPSQLSLLKPLQRGLPLQRHIGQLCQEHLVRCQRKKQCAFLKKADTLRRNTWNAPSSKPEWLSTHAEKCLDCCPKEEWRMCSTGLFPSSELTLHSQWSSRHLHWRMTISFCIWAHFEDSLTCWISNVFAFSQLAMLQSSRTQRETFSPGLLITPVKAPSLAPAASMVRSITATKHFQPTRKNTTRKSEALLREHKLFGQHHQAYFH